jgi:hypothetical protein
MEDYDKKTKQLLSGSSTGSITEKERNYMYLVNVDVCESLPRVHKSTKISNTIKTQRGEYITCLKPDDISFRLIFREPNCASQRLNHLLDILLKPYAR